MQNFFFQCSTLCILYQRQGLLNEVVAFAKFIHCVMDQVAGNIVEAVREIVQLFGMVPVVAEHVIEKCESFFRRRCRGV